MSKPVTHVPQMELWKGLGRGDLKGVAATQLCVVPTFVL